MKSTLLLCVVVAMLTGGCASHSQVFVNAEGAMYRCATQGVGLVPVLQAGKIQDDCVKSIRSAGYIEIEKAGALGILVSSVPPNIIKIINITPNSPASGAGISVGDNITQINGVHISTLGEFKALLFGTVGTKVTLDLLRDSKERQVTMLMVSRADLFGTK